MFLDCKFFNYSCFFSWYLVSLFPASFFVSSFRLNQFFYEIQLFFLPPFAIPVYLCILIFVYMIVFMSIIVYFRLSIILIFQWQIMETISDCLHFKVFLYVNSTTQRCPFKTFRKFFSICHPCQWHWWCTLGENISKKCQTAIMGYSGAWGKPIHEKNLKSKISWHCPFRKNRPIVVYSSVKKYFYPN